MQDERLQYIQCITYLENKTEAVLLADTENAFNSIN